jgi:hypothetical protein
MRTRGRARCRFSVCPVDVRRLASTGWRAWWNAISTTVEATLRRQLAGDLCSARRAQDIC